MDLSDQQNAAMLAVRDWVKAPKGQQVFRLFGYAGTGKTTIANTLIADLGLKALFAAYTGKAAMVMRQRGCVGAQTIHSLIYRIVMNSGERIRELRRQKQEAEKVMDQRRLKIINRDLEDALKEGRQPNFVLKEVSTVNEADLVVIDEASMVDERMGQDLESFGVKILVLGDPAQLPPVRGTGYFTEQKPDLMLTEIHRQAKDNPILMLATLARQGKLLPKGTWGDTAVVGKLDPEIALGVDQILCGKNKTRVQLNDRMRELLGYVGTYPLKGERLISLKNDHKQNILNGSMWTCKTDVRPDPEDNTDKFLLSLSSDDYEGVSLDIRSHGFALRGEENRLAPWENMQAHEFYYAYAITVHKSQGSQWSRVMLMDEWNMANTRRQWLYTGITRAQHSLVIYDPQAC